MQNLMLVIGGTGKAGRRVAQRLEAQGRPVRLVSRRLVLLSGRGETETQLAEDALRATGSRLLTFADAFADIDNATGRTATFTQVPIEEYAETGRHKRLPDDIVALTIYKAATSGVWSAV